MAEVKVLIEGYQKKDNKERVRVGSTVTLIKSRNNIIVDTGSFLDKNPLVNALKKEGLRPEDIDTVILTHLFRNAKVFLKFRGGEYPGQTHFPAERSVERTDLFKKK